MTYVELLEEAIREENALIDKIPFSHEIPSKKYDVERQKALIRLTLLLKEREMFK